MARWDDRAWRGPNTIILNCDVLSSFFYLLTLQIVDDDDVRESLLICCSREREECRCILVGSWLLR